MIASKRFFRGAALTATGLLILSAGSLSAQEFRPVNLVSDDQAVHPALIDDPNLVNAWGISHSPTSPFWVSDNGKGVSTLYRVNPVTDAPSIVPLVVTIPGAGNPTGQAFNPLASSGAFNKDNFLFVSEDGTVSGWRGALGTTAETLAPADPGNLYKGMELAGVSGHGYIYAANFKSGKIDILKGDPGAPNLPGSFTDPGLPAGYAPFNVRNLGGTLYVTYALQGAGVDEISGPGHGFVDAFDLQGNFLRRVGSQGTLNSPWGLEIAPGSFGPMAGDLLVGNFGDGTINAYDLSGVFKGQVLGENGTPLSIDGLWGLTVGNDGGAGSSGRVYFTAGPDGESHGLFGVLRSVPDGGSALVLFAMSLSGMALCSRKMRA